MSKLSLSLSIALLKSATSSESPPHARANVDLTLVKRTVSKSLHTVAAESDSSKLQKTALSLKHDSDSSTLKVSHPRHGHKKVSLQKNPRSIATQHHHHNHHLKLFEEKAHHKRKNITASSFLASSVQDPNIRSAPPFTSKAKFYETYYTVDLDVGGQKVQAVPDTGSFSLLVTSARCRECANGVSSFSVSSSSLSSSLSFLQDNTARLKDGCCPMRAFNSHLSGAYRKSEGEAEITFGSGVVRCLAGTDDVHLGKTIVKSQKIWEITWMDAGMRQIWYDGARFDAILGLGKLDWVPDSKHESTVLKNLHIQRFGMCLGNGETSDSKIYWGVWPQPGQDSVQKTLAVVGEKHWGVKLAGYGLFKESDIASGNGNLVPGAGGNGGSNFFESVGLVNNGGGGFFGNRGLDLMGTRTKDRGLEHITFVPPSVAVVDSGTSAIAVPSGVYDSLMKKIADIDCSRLGAGGERWVLRLLLGEGSEQQHFDVPMEAWLKTSSSSSSSSFTELSEMSRHNADESVTIACEHSFAKSPMGESSSLGPIWILGQPFVHSYLVFYDRHFQANRVGRGMSSTTLVEKGRRIVEKGGQTNEYSKAESSDKGVSSSSGGDSSFQNIARVDKLETAEDLKTLNTKELQEKYDKTLGHAVMLFVKREAHTRCPELTSEGDGHVGNKNEAVFIADQEDDKGETLTSQNVVMAQHRRTYVDTSLPTVNMHMALTGDKAFARTSTRKMTKESAKSFHRARMWSAMKAQKLNFDFGGTSSSKNTTNMSSDLASSKRKNLHLQSITLDEMGEVGSAPLRAHRMPPGKNAFGRLGTFWDGKI